MRFHAWTSRVHELLSKAKVNIDAGPAPAPAAVGAQATHGGRRGPDPGERPDPAVRVRSPAREARYHDAADDVISIASSKTAATRDLHHTLDDRLAEDMRVRIERRRERHRRATHEVDLTDGCKAFVPELRQVQWPKKFKIDVEKYDGKGDPKYFLALYSLAAACAGADERIMANWFPLALKGDAQSWLFNLPSCSIKSWSELKSMFLGAFHGGFKRPGIMADLHSLVQRPDESLRLFVQRCCAMMNTIPCVKEASVIAIFHQNVRNPRMHEKLAVRDVQTMQELWELANKCAKAEEGSRLPGEATPGDSAAPTKPKKRDSGHDKRVLAAEPKSKKSNSSSSSEVADDEPCTFHPDGNHTKKECRRGRHAGPPRRFSGNNTGFTWFVCGQPDHIVRDCTQRGIGGTPPGGRDNPPWGNTDNQGGEFVTPGGNCGKFQEPRGVVGCIHGGASAPPSSGANSRLIRDLSAAEPAFELRQPLAWSAQPISFDAGDHPPSRSGVGRIPLVVSPTIQNFKVAKMLVDGRAGLNLLSAGILSKLQISPSRLLPTGAFQGAGHGLIRPLGRITLPVTFGSIDNFRTEDIEFDVADTPLPYNGILGRPALAKFMAASHYSYNVMKIPGEWGIITIKNDRKDAIYRVNIMNESVTAAVHEEADGDALQIVKDPGSSSQAGGSYPVPAKKKFAQDKHLTKKISLTGDGNHLVTIGAHLPIK